MRRIYLIKYVNEDKKKEVALVENDYQFNSFMNDGKIKVLDFIRLSLNGSSFQQRRENLRELAIETQIFDYDSDINFSMMELATIENYFRKYGKLYGLLKEFEENAIC